MIDNALSAANTLCPKLDFFLLQTGGKVNWVVLLPRVFANLSQGYGILGYGFPPAPWKEDLPRMPEPFASKIFNYKQFDKMVEHAGHGSWKWSESRASFLVRSKFTTFLKRVLMWLTWDLAGLRSSP